MIDKINFCAFYVFQALVQMSVLNKSLSRKPKILPALAFFIVYFAAAVAPIPLPLGLLFTIVGSVLYCRFALCVSRSAAALNGILSAEIMWLSIGITDSLTALAVGVIIAGGTRLNGTAVMIAGNILQFVLYCFIFSAVQKVINNERAGQRSIPIVLFPLILIFIVEIYVVTVVYNYADTDINSVRDLNLLLFQLLGTASIFCVLYAYKKCADNFRMEQRIMIFERERNYQSRYADEAKAHYNAARSLRHDFKNHILIINGLLSKKQYDQASEYIEKLGGLACGSEFLYNTGSLILDIILNNKLADISDDVEIRVKVGDIPDTIDETDICTIFTNAVDNAVHALSRSHGNDKFLSVTTEKRGGLFFIKFENSFDGKPFKSGTGLENIRTAAEKYNGTIQIEAEENIFTLKVIMCFSRH